MTTTASQTLSAENSAELHRLNRAIKRSRRFNLIIAEYNDQALRRHLIDEIEKLSYHNATQLDLSPEKIPDVSFFERNLRHLAEHYTIIHVFNLESRTPDDAFRSFLQEINLHRERIAEYAPVNIILWSLEYQLQRYITFAPDLWSWNSAIVRFHTEKMSQELEYISDDHTLAELNLPETQHRIRTLIEFLKPKAAGSLSDAETSLLRELGAYNKRIGVYGAVYGYLDKNLNEFRNEINTLMKTALVQNDSPKLPIPGENLREEIRYVSQQLSARDKGNPLDLVRWIEPALSLLERSDEENEDIARLLNNLSLIYRDMGDLEQALEYQKKATGIREKVLPDDHPSLAASYNNLSMIYKDMGDLEQALNYQKKATGIWEKVLPDDHPDLAASYNNLSMIYWDKGNLDQALVYQKKATGIYEKVLSADHPNLATLYNNLSMIYLNEGDLVQALDYQKKATGIYEKVLSADHPYLALSYNNMALIHHDKGDLEQALDYAKKALAIVEKKLPEGHPHRTGVHNLLASIYDAMGDHKKAQRHRKKAEV